MRTFYFLTFGLILFCLPFTGNSQSLKETKTELAIEIEKKDASGDSANDGYIHLKISGGKEPYSIHVFSTSQQSEKTNNKELKLHNLKPGTYLFIVQDNHKTIRQESVEISVRK